LIAEGNTLINGNDDSSMQLDTMGFLGKRSNAMAKETDAPPTGLRKGQQMKVQQITPPLCHGHSWTKKNC
jgi:hypothetical protein